MKNDTEIQLSKKPLWKRNIAIHEAGHALAAWLSGSQQKYLVRSTGTQYAAKLRIQRAYYLANAN
ncbi:TPA: hypothetical protein ACQ7GP_004393 [Klebsiella pneumoniae]